jgi:hypothetical protein
MTVEDVPAPPASDEVDEVGDGDQLDKRDQRDQRDHLAQRDPGLVDVALSSPHGEAWGLFVEAALSATSMDDAEADAETARLALREGPEDHDRAMAGDVGAIDAASDASVGSRETKEPGAGAFALSGPGVPASNDATDAARAALSPRDVPGTGRRVAGHLAAALGLAFLAVGTAATSANGSLYRMDGWGVGVMLTAFVALITQGLAAYATMHAPRPPTKLLIASSALPFAVAAFASFAVFPRALRDFSTSGLRSYPTFLVLAGCVGAAAFLASALSLRASLRGLLTLVPAVLAALAEPATSDEPSAALITDAPPGLGDGLAPVSAAASVAEALERAETRALFALVASVAAGIVVVVAVLFFGLPMSSTLVFFVFGTTLLGLTARTHALGRGALEILPPSGLRERIAARLGPLPIFAAGASLLLGLSLAMGIRYEMLSYLSLADAESAALTGWSPTAHAAGLDRVLLALPPLLALLGTAGFWLPPRLLPTRAEARVPLPPLAAPFPERRLWIAAIVAAVTCAGLLLRMEDLYERRVAPARERYLVQVAKDQPT